MTTYIISKILNDTTQLYSNIIDIQLYLDLSLCHIVLEQIGEILTKHCNQLGKEIYNYR